MATTTTKAANEASLPRVIEWVRVSTEKQAKNDNPELQRRDLDRWRTTHPTGPVLARIDSAISGAKDAKDRPDLLHLEALSQPGAYDELRVWKIDRLTRHEEVRERFIVFECAKRVGAVIVEVANGHVIDPRTDIGEVDFYLNTFMAQKDRRDILHKTQVNQRAKALEGRCIFQVPWGRTWDRKTKTWGLDARLAAIYREILHRVINGESLEEIAAWLNREGLTSPRGREWKPSNVWNLVHARHVIGEHVLYGQVVKGLPAIVDAATHTAAVQALGSKARRTGGPTPTIVALIRKVGLCGECGSPLYIFVSGKHAYYLCRRGRLARRGGGDMDIPAACRTSYRVDKIDAAIGEEVRRFLRNPSAYLKGARKDNAKDVIDEARRTIAAAERDLKRLDAEEERLGRLTVRGAISEEKGEKLLREGKARRASAEADLAAAQGRLGAAERSQTMTTDVEAKIRAMEARATNASLADLHALIRDLCRAPGTGVKLYADGYFEAPFSVDMHDVVQVNSSERARPAERIGNAQVSDISGFPVRLRGSVMHCASRPPDRTSTGRFRRHS